MEQAKLISLDAIREIKKVQQSYPEYEQQIAQMGKLELLEEMIRFQERRSQLGKLTPELMVKGKVLFRALEESAETRELLLLTSSYRKHLELELQAYLEALAPVQEAPTAQTT